MTDDQIRLLVREILARHLGPTSPPGTATEAAGRAAGRAVAPSATAPVTVTASAQGGLAVAAAPGATVHVHVSHAVLAVPVLSDGTETGPCDLEPHGPCSQCGFCQSLGH